LSACTTFVHAALRALVCLNSRVSPRGLLTGSLGKAMI